MEKLCLAYLTLEEVVERYRNQVREGTLRNWRSKRIGPSFVKIGKAILYPIEELARWDRSNLFPVSVDQLRSSAPTTPKEKWTEWTGLTFD